MTDQSTVDSIERFRTLWETLLPIGRAVDGGGYARHGWDEAELACRVWFDAEAARRGMAVHADGNGNRWAWWGDPDAGGAVVTGSHLDSVPHGGAYDGPLGVVSGFLAVDLLRERGVVPSRPVGVAAFCEEEGARFRIACLGSRLLTGALDAERAAGLVDRDGRTLAGAMAAAGADPNALGPDRRLLDRIGCYLELHIEQGRGLVDVDSPVGVAESIWPHGRWRFEFTGEANHAGTTRMADRHDPMLTYAMTALAAGKQARLVDARATFGRISVEPNGTNAVPSKVTAWLDARAAEQSTLDGVLAAIGRQATERAGRDGTGLAITAESLTGLVEFDPVLAGKLAARIGTDGRPAPILPTAAGHDAGVLAIAGVPTAMLFVRNPTGVSHSPAETATDRDCAAGVTALADAVEELVT